MKSIYYATDLHAEFMELCKDGKQREVFSTGYNVLDEYMNLAPGYVGIATGIPSMGKSEFADAVAVNMAIIYGWKWCFFSPENYPIAEHMGKLAEKYIGKRLDLFTVKEKQAASSWINEHFVWLYPPEDDLNLSNILKLVCEVNKTFALNAFILDPWNEITHDQQGKRDDQYLSVALRTLRRFCRDKNHFGLVIAHPNKTEKNTDGTYKPPSLYDLNGGAMWRNKADYGFCIHRPDVRQHRIEVHIGKVKFKWMGKPGVINLDYDVQSGRFKDTFEKKFTLPEERFPDAPF